MISRLLVANRGEIARRIFGTCRAAGIATIAVFSDPDATASHVAEADAAVRLPGATAAVTYLNGPAIVSAALAAGADAIHPGYGFLAEDPGFARAVAAAGLTWVGPPPVAMEAMSLKTTARKVAAGAGLPVLPELDPEAVTKFPVLIKAAAGGGGRGMRAVADRAGLAEALESARREATAAFGDATVYCEPLLTGARHIEVQVLADRAGTVWALTERDCSVQRRYQKVIEESPSPAVGPRLRSLLRDAAAGLAAAVGYQGAGTVEFLVSGPDFFFLEFNTRLQVEHPVTELVHGIDLVALQLRIAEGQPLAPRPPEPDGHAIEARLYAEDPAAGFRPSAGPLHRFEIPGVDRRFRHGRRDQPVLRLDSGYESGQVISPHYDAMLAKLIAWAPGSSQVADAVGGGSGIAGGAGGPDSAGPGMAVRLAAIRRLSAGLAGARIAGPPTNRDLLLRILADPVFRTGSADTGLLAGYDMTALIPSRAAVALSALAGAVAGAAARRAAAPMPAAILGGFRNVRSEPQRAAMASPLGRVDVAYDWTRTGLRPGAIQVDGTAAGPGPGEPLAVAEAGPDRVTLDVAGVRHRFDVTAAGSELWIDSAFGSVRLTRLERLPEPVPALEPGSLLAPMPGSVTKLSAAVGDLVTAGQVILVLEAMKMEHQITAPTDGRVTELRVSQSAQVSAGDVLAIVVAADPAAQAPAAQAPATP